MKYLSLIFPLALVACTPARDAIRTTGGAIVGQVHESPDVDAKVRCFEGPVCKDIEVRRIQVEKDGPVIVVLRNRSGDALSVQVQLEWVRDDGGRDDVTRFHSVAMAPRQEGILEMPGFGRGKDGHSLMVTVRDPRAVR